MPIDQNGYTHPDVDEKTDIYWFATLNCNERWSAKKTIDPNRLNEDQPVKRRGRGVKNSVWKKKLTTTRWQRWAAFLKRVAGFSSQNRKEEKTRKTSEAKHEWTGIELQMTCFQKKSLTHRLGRQARMEKERQEDTHTDKKTDNRQRKMDSEKKKRRWCECVER